MIKITAPTATILAGGALYDYATSLNNAYSAIIQRESQDGITEYSNVPLHAKITIAHVQGIIAVGGEIENFPAFIKVSNLDDTIPVGLPYSIKVDEEGNESQKTWRDLESSTQKYTPANDESQFIGTQALNDGNSVLKGSEIVQYLNAGITVLSTLEIQQFLITD